ncbi:MAG TPA: hypothetical protein VJ698_14450 [Noviherbaspirillum sp.]|uniref:hypothetical protein n=1 Tax=Noviherbaspirillum sp. TaxID=1926288 RepID=UPI002B459D61|nr:hypothetical protein [Noviherbaspirillum sp.]HJV86668.1 hypothetical protein [Noviherbaspirillum sp.]
MKPEDQMDFPTLVPSKRRMARAAVFIAVPMLAIGLLLGVMVYYAPGSALARALGGAFLAGGPSAFMAPGGRMLALKAGAVWAASLVFLVGPFIFMAWLSYQVKKEYNRLRDEQRMNEYRRKIAGKPRE